MTAPLQARRHTCKAITNTTIGGDWVQQLRKQATNRPVMTERCAPACDHKVEISENQVSRVSIPSWD
jgi:hypothetical protein